MKKIAVLGAGAFGFAMTKVIAENNPQLNIFLFDVQEEVINNLKQTQEHPFFYPGIKIPPQVKVTLNVQETIIDAELIVLCIPSKFLRNAIKNFKKYLAQEVIFLNLAKGLEEGTNNRVSEILDEELKGLPIKYFVCALSGGMIAKEVVEEAPLCANLACSNLQIAQKLAQLIKNNYLRINPSDDLTGVELSGAFKNVIAIGAGIFDGLGYSESSKSAFISDAAQEMSLLALALGSKKETFQSGGQAWLGDLMTTCFGNSRNRELGELIGKGVPVMEAVEIMIKNNKSVEGYITTKVVRELTITYSLHLQLLKTIYEVLYENKKPVELIKVFINNKA